LGYFNQSNKDISANRFTGIQAGISIPLLYHAQKGRIKASVIDNQITQTNFEYVSSSFRNEMRVLIQEYSQYKISFEFYSSTALPQADLIILQAVKSYKSGSIGYLEYVQLLRQAIEIKNKYLETLNAYNQSIIRIEKIINHIK
jgi:heavy metal efflux system protein